MPTAKSKRIGERLPRPNLIRISDVVAIPITEGCYAYARAIGPASLAILVIKPSSSLLTISDIIRQNPPTAFFVEYYEPTDTPEWIFLGKWPFGSPEEAKSPPVYFHDFSRPGHVVVLDNGIHRRALLSEVEGMQEHGLKAHSEIVSVILNYWKSGHVCDN